MHTIRRRAPSPNNLFRDQNHDIALHERSPLKTRASRLKETAREADLSTTTPHQPRHVKLELASEMLSHV